jgi:hypothetical protein
VAVIHGFFGFATPFDSEVGSWGDAGATVNNERHDHVTRRYSTAKSARRMPQVKHLL